MKPDFDATQQAAQTLLRNIKARLPQLSALLEKVSSHWHGEDGFYRFYHQSFKVYHGQNLRRLGAFRAHVSAAPLKAGSVLSSQAGCADLSEGGAKG